MAKGNKRTRLILNIASYLMRHSEVPLTKLAHEFNVSKKAMQKIVSEEMHFSDVVPTADFGSVCAFIEYDESIGDFIVDMVQTDALRTPVKLLEEEAMAMRLLLSAYDAPAGTGFDEIVSGLQQKLAKAVGIDEEEDTAFAKAKNSMALDEIIVLLEDALGGCNIVEIDYYSAEHRERMKRRIQPYAVFQESGRYYLRGFCELRNAPRSFRIDRIAEVEIFDETFKMPKNAKVVPTAVPGWDGVPTKETFTVRIEPSVADDVERQWEGVARSMKRELDGSIQMKLPLYSRSWALGWVLSFGPNAELLAPERLREALVDRVEVMLESVS